MHQLVVSIVLAALSGLPSEMAFAQGSLKSLRQGMDRLEQNNLETVQRHLYRSDVVGVAFSGSSSDFGGDVAARLQQRFVDMEGVITSLTGQVEEIKFELDQIRSRLEKLIIDIDYRLVEFQRRSKSDSQVAESEESTTNTSITGKGISGSRTERESVFAFGGRSPGQEEPIDGPVKAPVPSTNGVKADKTVALPKGSAKEHYESISILLSQGDYVEAERSLLAFLEIYPEDVLAGNAQYWLGETYYVRGEFRQAAVAFAKGYRKYVKSSKTPASVLKLGMSLARLERAQDACTAFNRLAVEFPKASGNLQQRAALEKKRLGCK